MSGLPEHPATLTPPIVLSPIRRIEILIGNFSFVISLIYGLAVIHAFQEHRRYLTIAQINYRTEVPRAVVCRCLHTPIWFGYATINRHTYSLSPKALILGHVYLSSTPLAVTA